MSLDRHRIAVLATTVSIVVLLPATFAGVWYLVETIRGASYPDVAGLGVMGPGT